MNLIYLRAKQCTLFSFFEIEMDLKSIEAIKNRNNNHMQMLFSNVLNICFGSHSVWNSWCDSKINCINQKPIEWFWLSNTKCTHLMLIARDDPISCSFLRFEKSHSPQQKTCKELRSLKLLNYAPHFFLPFFFFHLRRLLYYPYPTNLFFGDVSFS